MQNKKVWEAIERDVVNSNIPEVEKSKLLQSFMRLKEHKVNLMITGATGCGKSSTINALFNRNVAKVGTSPDPETMNITKYEFDNLILWDSPGLGDGEEADNCHAKNIINKLNERDTKGNLLIDLVLVILDGSTRDLGTTYELINSVIIPNLGEDKKSRILVAINQADVAMKGRYWNYDKNVPEPQLVEFLEEKAISVRRRIREGTGVDVMPIYYSAGYTDDNGQSKPYNLSKLLYNIIQSTPKEKRLSYVDTLNKSEEMWKSNDTLKNYNEEIQKSFFETIGDCASDGADFGEEIGSIFGEKGETVGRIAGAIGGAVVGAAKGAWSAAKRVWGSIFG